jgi:tRNA pseudouridine55 synthase
MRRRPARPVDGVLLLDKPSGMSSNAALQAARRLLQAAKAGHTGTLDPLACGLLPLAFGEATKFSQLLLDADKTYETELALGVRTDSGDAEGRVVEVRPVAVERGLVERVVARFRGEIEQVPPMYSALKREGQPLYRLARQGLVVERPPRRVVIRALDILGFWGDRLNLRVHCSKGTYIRTLAEDIGEALGCGAHVLRLRRCAAGDFSLQEALTLAQLEALPEVDRAAVLRPVDCLLASWPRVDLDAAAARRFRHGARIELTDASGAAAGPRRVYGAGTFLGVGQAQAGLLLPQRLLGVAGPVQASGKLEDS